MEEIFAYLKDVLGVKYLPLAAHGAIHSLPELPSSSEQPMVDLPSSPAVFPESRSANNLAELEAGIQGCTLCKLHKNRKNIVFGTGPAKADLMFVGEGPGEHEDQQGMPFVGPAGQLLTKMIEAMGLKREQVYIANVVKCRPPMNRNPEADEIHECSPFLKNQIKMVDPKIIVALGTFAAQTLLHTDERISRLRGRVIDGENRKIIATFHPSYLLRNPSEKKAAWEDLKLAMQVLAKSPG